MQKKTVITSSGEGSSREFELIYYDSTPLQQVKEFLKISKGIWENKKRDVDAQSDLGGRPRPTSFWRRMRRR